MLSAQWKNRSIDDLTTGELRLALNDAIAELHFVRRGTSSTDVFAVAVVCFLAGSATALIVGVLSALIM